MTATKTLIFRYDNTGHHRKLNPTTYPHHKHVGHEGNVVAAPVSDLLTVQERIVEIEQTVQERYGVQTMVVVMPEPT